MICIRIGLILPQTNETVVVKICPTSKVRQNKFPNPRSNKHTSDSDLKLFVKFFVD